MLCHLGNPSGEMSAKRLSNEGEPGRAGQGGLPGTDRSGRGTLFGAEGRENLGDVPGVESDVARSQEVSEIICDSLVIALGRGEVSPGYRSESAKSDRSLQGEADRLFLDSGGSGFRDASGGDEPA